jgi:hypothetical protein
MLVSTIPFEDASERRNESSMFLSHRPMQIRDVSRDDLGYGCAQFCSLSSFSELTGQKTCNSVHRELQAIDLHLTDPIGFTLDVKPLSGGGVRRRNIEQRDGRLTYARNQSAIAC